MIVYLHGLSSSPLSSKAVLFAEYCAQHGVDCVVPQLHHRPQQAAAQIDSLLQGGNEHLLVGSSMGGFYATWFCEKYPKVRAVLINPAVRMADKITDYVGQEQRNAETGESYMFTAAHLDEFRALTTEAIAAPHKYLLLVQSGDEMLDYREAVEFYAGAQQIVEEGGDHYFVDFARHLPTIIRFAGSTTGG